MRFNKDSAGRKDFKFIALFVLSGDGKWVITSIKKIKEIGLSERNTRVTVAKF